MGVKMDILPEKNVIEKSWSAKNFSVHPKLGARSPPLNMATLIRRGKRRLEDRHADNEKKSS